jgi:hypothetical protein
VVIAKDVDVLVDVEGGLVEPDAAGSTELDVVDEVVKVVVDSPEPVDVQAPRTRARPRQARTGSPLRPPNPIDRRRGLKWLPPFPVAPRTLRIGRDGCRGDLQEPSSRHPPKGRRPTADATALSNRCQQPSNEEQGQPGRERTASAYLDNRVAPCHPSVSSPVRNPPTGTSHAPGGS